MGRRGADDPGMEVPGMAVEPRKVTAEELLGMPDDGLRYELVGGAEEDGAGGQ